MARRSNVFIYLIKGHGHYNDRAHALACNPTCEGSDLVFTYGADFVSSHISTD
jgi:hypothetical protein